MDDTTGTAPLRGRHHAVSHGVVMKHVVIPHPRYRPSMSNFPALAPADDDVQFKEAGLQMLQILTDTLLEATEDAGILGDAVDGVLAGPLHALADVVCSRFVGAGSLFPDWSPLQCVHEVRLCPVAAVEKCVPHRLRCQRQRRVATLAQPVAFPAVRCPLRVSSRPRRCFPQLCPLVFCWR